MRGLKLATWAGVSCLTFASAGMALPVPIQSDESWPATKDESWRLGQRFAACSAYLSFIALIDRKANLPASADQLENLARGWKSAGMLFLAVGIDPSRATETESTFDNLVDLKIADLKAEDELDPLGLEKIPQEFARECHPLVTMQQEVIEDMRRGKIAR